MGMIFCRGCGKEIHESAKSCPHCGAPQTSAQSIVLPWSTGRMVFYGIVGFFLPLIGVVAGVVGLLKEPRRKQGAILLALAICGTIFLSVATGKKPFQSGQSTSIETLVNATPAQLSPTGELAAMFHLGSDNTDLQRENKLKEIKGKIVEWALPVYEVEKDGKDYIVHTSESAYIIGAIVHLTPRNDQDKAAIEALKTGDLVSFKGIINDDFLRSLEIKPAVLFKPASVLPAASVAPVALSASEPVAAPAVQEPIPVPTTQDGQNPENSQFSDEAVVE